MAKNRTIFVCAECEYQNPKWLGRCPECKAWNSLTEQSSVNSAPPVQTLRGNKAAPTPIHEVSLASGGELRVTSGIGELDTPLGGGLVHGSLVLLGGDPGVGKSTLLLMAAHRFAERGPPVLYASGEESVQQVRMRAERLGVHAPSLHLLSSTDWTHIEASCRALKPAVLVVDSVQTVAAPELANLPGSVTQVREVAHRAMNLAKGSQTAILLVGHVTKSGDLAGPKVLEHFVDTVLHFEGDGRSALRILRAVKNRFGPAGELGMFEMAEDGLRPVPDASARLLQERRQDAAGTAVVAALEGSRALLAEVQALVGPPMPQTPARTCIGVDRTRVQMLAAVAEKHGVRLHDRDIYVNAAGGVRLTEPAADLAILAAMASSLADVPLPTDAIWLGEVGLVGEIRAVPHPALRLREAQRHGFTRVIGPPRCQKHLPDGLELSAVQTVHDALDLLTGSNR